MNITQRGGVMIHSETLLEFVRPYYADTENYDERKWGADSFRYALELCLDAVVKIKI